MSNQLFLGGVFNSLYVYVTVRLDPSCLKAAALTVCDVMYLCQLNEVYSGNRKIIEFSYLLHVLSYIVQSLSQPHVSCKNTRVNDSYILVVCILHRLHHTPGGAGPLYRALSV